jgi:hypothetical protein
MKIIKERDMEGKKNKGVKYKKAVERLYSGSPYMRMIMEDEKVFIPTGFVLVSSSIRKTERMEIPVGGVLRGVQWECSYGILAKSFLMMMCCGVLTVHAAKGPILRVPLKTVPAYVPDLAFQNVYPISPVDRLGYLITPGMWAEIDFVDAPSGYDEDGNPTSFYKWSSFPEETKVRLLLHGTPKR